MTDDKHLLAAYRDLRKAVQENASQLAAKATKAATPTAGHIATLDSGGNLIDGGYSPSGLSAAITPGIVAVSGNKTLALTDAGAVQKVSAAATITIPAHADVALPIGVEIVILSYTALDIAVTPATNVTLYSASSYRKINGQYGAATLKQISENEWVLIGALKP